MYFDGVDAHKEIIAAIGLLDLYESFDFPKKKINVDERYDWAKRQIEDDVNHEKFRMYFAVHETEAWLLSQPEIFPTKVKEKLPHKKIQNPERINFYKYH